MLVVSGKEEDAVGADGAADGSAELVLTVVGLEVQESRLRSEHAVANKVKAGSVKVVGS
jgi:hypothetical protein